MTKTQYFGILATAWIAPINNHDWKINMVVGSVYVVATLVSAFWLDKK